MNQKSIFLYILTSYVDRKCYVGVSQDITHRLRNHLNGHHRSTRAWIEELRAYECEPQMTILGELSPDVVDRAEEDVIALFRMTRGPACLNRYSRSVHRAGDRHKLNRLYS